MARWLQNMKLRNKIVLAVVCFSFVPMVYICVYAYTNSTVNVMDLAVDYATEQIINTNEAIVNERDRLFHVLSTTINDSSFLTLVNEEKSRAGNAVYTEGNVADELNAIMQRENDIDSIYLYLENGDIIAAQTADKVDANYDINKCDWYANAQNSSSATTFIPPHVDYQAESKARTVISFFIKGYVEKDQELSQVTMVCNILLIDWLNDYYGEQYDHNLLVINESGQMVYSRNGKLLANPAREIFGIDVVYNDSGYGFTEIDGINYLTVWSPSVIPTLKIIKITEHEELFFDIERMRETTFLLIILACILLFGSMLVLTNSIVRPIKYLQQSIKQVEDGDIHVKQYQFGKDEIGELSRHYYSMMDKIEALIAQNELNHRKRLELETRLLQAQINPHFLFNTLNTIRSLALIQGNKTIAYALKSLIALLESSVRVGQNFITIREEIEQIKNYEDIQRLRYVDRFDVEYKCMEDVLEYQTLKFLLQPIVENAIFHGLDQEESNGKIVISIWKNDEFIKYCVEDNGRGMTPEKCKELRENLDAELFSSGFNNIGLKNVSDRIKMFFGIENPVKITSELGVGTTVEVTIPAKKQVEEGEIQIC